MISLETICAASLHHCFVFSLQQTLGFRDLLLTEDNSILDADEVEAALSALNNELDRMEGTLTEWSRGPEDPPPLRHV
jgi:hypothetical protein